ncbi:hypothetical protein [uncultured Mediterranean phage uvDeep-CGR2-KM19-C37]|nr:hypothetical protein [uncultured Mediterranean phage uvDeep-CGR2-KM19-C37]
MPKESRADKLVNSVIDQKEQLYGRFLASAKRRDKIHEKAIHKALDLPLDDDVNVTNINQRGLGLLGVIGSMGIGAAVMAGGMKVFDWPAPPPKHAVAPSEIEIEVWSDGETIEVRPVDE